MPVIIQDLIKKNIGNYPSIYPTRLTEAQYRYAAAQEIPLATITQEQQRAVQTEKEQLLARLENVYEGTSQQITCSETEIKIEPTAETTKQYYTNSEITVQVLKDKSVSGVNDQPVQRRKDDEGLLGVLNRIRSTKEHYANEPIPANTERIFTAYENFIKVEDKEGKPVEITHVELREGLPALLSIEGDDGKVTVIEDNGEYHCIDIAYVAVQAKFDGKARTIIQPSGGVELPWQDFLTACDLGFKKTTVGEQTSIRTGSNKQDPHGREYEFEFLRRYVLRQAREAALKRLYNPSENRAKFDTIYAEEKETEPKEVQIKVQLAGKQEAEALIEHLLSQTDNEDLGIVDQHDKIYVQKGHRFPIERPGDISKRIRIETGREPMLTTKTVMEGPLDKKARHYRASPDQERIDLFGNRFL